MTTIYIHLSIITLNIIGLKSPIKRNGQTWIKKQNPSMCCLEEIRFNFKDRDDLKVKGEKRQSPTDRHCTPRTQELDALRWS